MASDPTAHAASRLSSDRIAAILLAECPGLSVSYAEGLGRDVVAEARDWVEGMERLQVELRGKVGE